MTKPTRCKRYSSEFKREAIALVTGANRGLRSHFVEALVEFGSKVYATALDIDTLGPLVRKHGDLIVSLVLDITDQAQVDPATPSGPGDAKAAFRAISMKFFSILSAPGG